jgi:HAMP domain-containing protein
MVEPIVAPADAGQGDQPIGEVRLTFSREPLNQYVGTRVRQGIVAITIQALATMVIVYFVLKWMRKPIVRISKVLQSISSGTNDIDVPGIDRNDEVGRMARAVDIFRRN